MDEEDDDDEEEDEQEEDKDRLRNAERKAPEPLQATPSFHSTCE